MNSQFLPIMTDLLDYARLAPSVHNAQPWRFAVDGMSVSLIVEPSRMLGPGDPTGRESWISFGICTEALLQAAAGLGLAGKIINLQTDKLEGTIATIEFAKKTRKQPEIIDALKNRHTYREKMLPANIPAALKTVCSSITSDLPGVNVCIMDDKNQIRRVGDLTLKAMSLALGDPKFRGELYEYVHYNWSPSRTGLHGYAMGEGWLGSAFGKWSVKLGLGLGIKAKHDQRRIMDASALFFVATKGDVPKFWLAAGRAYLRVALEVTKHGLAQGTLAAPVEAASFHEDIEKMLDTSYRIQTMLRVGGYSRIPKRTSPRLEIGDLT